MANDKLRFLALRDLLLKETDKDHVLNATEIDEKIQRQFDCGYPRRTVYQDIRLLEDYGMDIRQKKGNSFGYYVNSRKFDLAELKLLVDAVQSSRFITKDQSDALIAKLETEANRWNADQLHRQVHIINRVKTDNEKVYEVIDAIHQAIHLNRQIRFKYCDWNLKKEMVERRKGMSYLLSPWALTIDNENYYLVAYGERPGGEDSGKIMHYRVDKMRDVEILEKERLGKDEFLNFDLPSYAGKTFGMFRGEERSVTLIGEKRMAGVVIDRLGTDILLRPFEEDRFLATARVAVSPLFFSWIDGLRQTVLIYGPDDVLDEYSKYLEEQSAAQQAVRELKKRKSRKKD